MIERIEVDEKSLTRLVAALRKEEDGNELTRDLVERLTAAVSSAAEEAKTEILSMSSLSGTHSPKLSTAIASRVSVRIRTGGSRPGIAIIAGKTGMPRGFRNAPKRTNAAKWRHMVYGNPDVWRDQVGRPGWFDATISRHRPAAIKAAEEAMDEMARRIDARTKG